jgi:hypothetical protein
MNIVILSDFAYVDGGGSKIALGSVGPLAERGHRVLVLTAIGPVDYLHFKPEPAAYPALLANRFIDVEQREPANVESTSKLR